MKLEEAEASFSVHSILVSVRSSLIKKLKVLKMANIRIALVGIG